MLSRALTVAAVVLVSLLAPAFAQAAEDTTPPKTNILLAYEYEQRLKLGFFASEPTSTIECRVDGGPYVPCKAGSGPGHDWMSDQQLSGFHVAQVRSTDLAGNVEVDPPSRTFYIKPNPPTITSDIGSVPGRDGWTADTTPTFHLASPDPRVSSFQCGVDWIYSGIPMYPHEVCGADWTPSQPLSEGKHEMAALAVDELGFTSSTYGRTYNFKIDSRPPWLTLVTPGRVLEGAPVKIKIAAYDDNRAEQRCTLDGHAIRCKPQVFEDLEIGIHKVYARISDQAGNLRIEKARFKVSPR